MSLQILALSLKGFIGALHSFNDLILQPLTYKGSIAKTPSFAIVMGGGKIENNLD